MLWRVRTTLPDRPGSLAVLARSCGEAGVNILGLQIFPGIDAVTDELVLRTPPDWGLPELAGLVESSGGRVVGAAPCTEAALGDQPTRYVQAARTILTQPAAFPEVVASLFDAEADPEPGALAPVQDVMDMVVGDVQVQVRRTAPFTATEHARAAALAELVTDVLARGRGPAAPPSPGRRVGAGSRPEYVVDGDAVSAVIDGTSVGLAVVRPAVAEPAAEPAGEPAGGRGPPGHAARRPGLAAARDRHPAAHRRGPAGRTLGAQEIVLTTRADNQAVLPMVLAAGLRGRIRMSADVLTVRIAVRDLKPLPV